jgi:hypothetical protein
VLLSHFFLHSLNIFYRAQGKFMTFTELRISINRFPCWRKRCVDRRLTICTWALCFRCTLEFRYVLQKFTLSCFCYCLLPSDDWNWVDIERGFTLTIYIWSVRWFRWGGSTKIFQTGEGGRLWTFCPNDILVFIRFFIFFWSLLYFRDLVWVTHISNKL